MPAPRSVAVRIPPTMPTWNDARHSVSRFKVAPVLEAAPLGMPSPSLPSDLALFCGSTFRSRSRTSPRMGTPGSSFHTPSVWSTMGGRSGTDETRPVSSLADDHTGRPLLPRNNSRRSLSGGRRRLALDNDTLPSVRSYAGETCPAPGLVLGILDFETV